MDFQGIGRDRGAIKARSGWWALIPAANL